MQMKILLHQQLIESNTTLYSLNKDHNLCKKQSEGSTRSHHFDPYLVELKQIQ